ncbi:MAG: hypothetical protein HY744_09525 [Deltaproteobacteria bacterium]|nr:hypothetical protein [Deltaproteobacteria bacterium]
MSIRVASIATLAGAGLLWASCTIKDEETTGGKPPGGGCLVNQACCVLAQKQGESDPTKGAKDCSGKDLGGQEWCGQAAELAKKALNAQEVEGECVLGLTPDTVTRVPIVWVNSTDESKVALFDSTSGEEILRVETWGNFPNRTAVAADGSVWITNRESYQYVHIGLDGKVLCASEYGTSQQPDDPKKVGYTRAAAIDADGYAWIGFNDTGEVVRVDPKETDGKVTLTDPVSSKTIEAPKCKEVGRVKLETTYPYGLAADDRGGIWVGILGAGTVAKIDARTQKVVGEYDLGQDPKVEAAEGCLSLYGMAIDMDANPWFANMGCGSVIKVDGQTGKVIGVYEAPEEQAMGTARAIGIDRNGHLWVADNSSQYVHEFKPDGTWVKRVDVSCPDKSSYGTLGIGSDIDGDMWTVLQYDGLVSKYKTDGTKVGCYPKAPKPELASPYTYSDLTGSTNSLVTSQLGRWRAVVEHGSALQWALVSYRATIPEGTSVCIRVRAAQDKSKLASASWTPPMCAGDKVGEYTVHNLVPDGKPLVEKSPYLEIELGLNSTDPKVTPVVANLSVAGLK